MKYLILALLLTSCCARQPIEVQSDYITRMSLASYYLGTPDPKLVCPPQGQRLFISWNVPNDCLSLNDLHLNLTLRYHNRTECEKKFPIDKTRGDILFFLLDDQYEQTQGIQTYKVDLIGDGRILYKWRHQLWRERIQIKRDEDV